MNLSKLQNKLMRLELLRTVGELRQQERVRFLRNRDIKQKNDKFSEVLEISLQKIIGKYVCEIVDRLQHYLRELPQLRNVTVQVKILMYTRIIGTCECTKQILKMA